MRVRRLFLALVLGITCSLSSGGTVNAIDGLIDDEHQTDTQTQAPAAWGAVPDNNQYKYHKDELALFVHFSINTFMGVEWGNQIGCRDQDRDRFTLQSFDAETLVRTAKEAGLDWNQVEELDVHDYNEYYNNQLIEILGNSKYGNNGRFA